jgi:hypothetical protein
VKCHLRSNVAVKFFTGIGNIQPSVGMYFAYSGDNSPNQAYLKRGIVERTLPLHVARLDLVD